MLFSSKENGKLILLLEVQSSLIRGSIVWVVEDAQPHILFSESLPLGFKPHLGASYLVKVTLKGIKDVVNNAHKHLASVLKMDNTGDKPKKISEIHFILSSPWVLSQARSLSINFNEEKEIDEDKLRKLLDVERSKIKHEGELHLTAIEEKIFDVRLNGYTVENWKGRKTKNLEVSYALTVGSMDSIKKFRDSCDHLVRSSHIFFHSSLLLQYIGLRSVLNLHDNYLLVHVHGELTDVVMVEKGSCTFFGSFPLGINTIVRKIAHATKSDEKTADSLFSLYLGNKLDPSHTQSVETLMSDMTSAWMGEFTKLMRTGVSGKQIPEQVIIAARAHEDFFLKSYKSVHKEAKTRLLSVEEVSPQIVYEHLAYKPRLVSVYALGICDII